MTDTKHTCADNSNTLDPMVRCSICDKECADGEDPKHLPLYCNGSEGIMICIDCRITLWDGQIAKH